MSKLSSLEQLLIVSNAIADEMIDMSEAEFLEEFESEGISFSDDKREFLKILSAAQNTVEGRKGVVND